MTIMKPNRDVGITGYGAYVPRFRIKAEEIARVWKGNQDALPIREKSVPGPDEDTATMSIEAARAEAVEDVGCKPRLFEGSGVGRERCSSPSIQASAGMQQDYDGERSTSWWKGQLAAYCCRV